jgi:hypothetical protein
VSNTEEYPQKMTKRNPLTGRCISLMRASIPI